MVLDGNGKEAIRLSAAGSMLAVSFGLVIAVPLTLVVVRVYPTLESRMGIILLSIAGFLVLTEARYLTIKAIKRRLVGLAVMLSSGLLGFYVLTHGEIANPLLGNPSLLMPLFTGLFGVPLLAASIFENAELPEQRGGETAFPRRRIATSAFGGSLAGSIVGWIPGVSPAVATTLVQSTLPRSETEDESMRSFIVAVSGVNTSNAIFALLALEFIEKSRSGVTVALSQVESLTFGTLLVYLAALSVVSVLAFLSTLYVGEHAFDVLRRVDYRVLSLSIILLLVVLTLVFAGMPGIPVLVAATVIGLVPNYTKVRRVHCMGSL
ncbi:MAG: tripartite tricarboxylate transporter permease, partial [Halobacteria archaeon]|nr:tripartite tricarboxylate transporter permease [Halobacteria archaeon]